MMKMSRVYVAAILLCIGLSLYCLQNYFEAGVLPAARLDYAAAAHDGGKVSELKVITYNIHIGIGKDGKLDLDRIVQNIEQEDPDIVALQEVDRFLARSGLQDEAKYIADKLSMNCAYGKSLNVLWGAYGNAILSKYPLSDCKNIVLPFEGERRTALGATIVVNGEKIDVYNVHLGLSSKERARQVDKLMETVQSGGNTCILLGDFNSPDSELTGLAAIMSDSGSGNNDAPTFIYESGEGYRIDYIFFTPGLKLKAYKVVQADASDHNMVVSELELPGEVTK